MLYFLTAWGSGNSSMTSGKDIDKVDTDMVKTDMVEYLSNLSKFDKKSK